MNYRVEFEGNALVQLNGLPSDAFDALTDRVVDLVRAPWDAELMERGGNPARRQAFFGQGLGLITFDVDDRAELIRIFDIAWIGLCSSLALRRAISFVRVKQHPRSLRRRNSAG